MSNQTPVLGRPERPGCCFTGNGFQALDNLLGLCHGDDPTGRQHASVGDGPIQILLQQGCPSGIWFGGWVAKLTGREINSSPWPLSEGCQCPSGLASSNCWRQHQQQGLRALHHVEPLPSIEPLPRAQPPGRMAEHGQM